MWLGYLPLPPLSLEIVVFYNRETEIGGLKVWNYNKSIIDFTKGVKEVQIIVNDGLLWQGTILGGKG